MVKPNVSLRSFQRMIPEIINTYNQEVYSKVIRGLTGKDSAVLILSDKSRGFYAAGTKESRKEGAISYFLTVKAELEKSRFINKCIIEIDNYRFQQDFDFLKEPGELF